MYSYSPNTPTPSFDGVAPFADPFADLASVIMPTSIPAMLRHAEFFGVTNETLREAFNRVAAYFITEIDVKGELGDDEKTKHKDYLTDRAQVIPFLLEAGLSFLIYGNQYTSVLMPFTRYLVCPQCAARYRFAEFHSRPEYKFSWTGEFCGKCPACDFSGVFAGKKRPPVDEPDESRPLILRSWIPHDIRIVYNEATGQSAAFDWVIPADFRTDCRMGYNKSVLEDTPWPWLQAALNDENVRFTPKYMKHWREPAIAGLRFRGIGVPKSIINYRQAYYTQILRRMNETLALGHVVPFRVISPANTAGKGEEGDVLKSSFLGDLRSRVMGMWAAHRADPNAVHFSPIPLQMQALGADARQLIPFDLMNQGQEVLLNGCGVPTNWFRMDMTAQTAPVGLRMINRIWAPFVNGLNQLLNYIGTRAQFLLAWEEAKYSLTPVDIVDSVELANLRVQMAQAGLLSRTEALKQVKADFKTEVRQKLDDQKTEQTEQAHFQEEQDAFTFGQQLANAGPPPGQMGPGGQPPAGGDPSQQGGQPGQPGQPQPGQPQAAGTPPGSDPLQSLVPQPGTKIDPTEYLSRAQQTAQYLLTVPEGQRFGMLKQIREANDMFHQMVRAQLDKQRSDDRSKGQQMIQSQRNGGH